MQSDIYKLVGDHWTTAAALAVLVFNAGINWANFSYMKKAMVTKKDMEIGMLRFKEDINIHFMTRDDCTLFHELKERTNGNSNKPRREI